MNATKILILASVAIVIVLFVRLDLGHYFSLPFLKSEQAQLQDLTLKHPFQTPGLFFLIYVVMAAVSFPGAAVMTVAAGALFGVGWGTLIVSFASALGATLAFWGARYLFRDTVERRFAKMLGPIDAGIEREGGFYLFGLRLVPVFPFFVINLAMGLTTMRTWPYYWISQLGMLAGTVVYVNAGTQLGRIDSLQDILSPLVLTSFAVLGVFPLIARRILDWLAQRRRLAAYPKPEHFDANLVVIGAGSGGLISAYLAAALRGKVVLIEKNRMGGDCLNTGCVPSKTLLRSAKIASYMRRGSEFGLQAVWPEVDFPAVMERIRRAIARIEPHDSIERYTALGVECLIGEGRIISPYIVEVGTRRITTRSIIIASGGRPRIPDLPGLSEAPYVTSDNLWGITELPGRFLVLGGGAIGCEMAQAFARLGSSVSLVANKPRLLPKEDPDVSEFLLERFVSEGIDVRLAHTPLRVERDDRGQWRLVCRCAESEVALPFDRLLVAVGRKANIGGLGLQDLLLKLSPEGAVEVDDFLRTSIPNIYAVGDVIGHYQFTHTASHQAYSAVLNCLFGAMKKFRVDYSVIPWTTFTDPEVAHVGLNEQQARRQSVSYEVSRYAFAELDRAIAEEEAHGWVKVLTEGGSDRILGATIVGAHAGELIAEFVLAMRHGLGLKKILGTIHVYPTLSEANKFAAGVWRRAHSSDRALRWLERYHRWRLGGPA